MTESCALEFVEAAAVRPLRHEVLRPGRPAADAVFEGDDDPRAAHVAVRGRGVFERRAGPRPEVLAVGSVVPSAPPWEPARAGWRIRGMATRPDARGRGLGRAVLDALLAHVAGHGGGLAWCNARVGVQRFYSAAGFTPRGEEFDVAGIGPHVQMWRTVGAAGS